MLYLIEHKDFKDYKTIYQDELNWFLSKKFDKYRVIFDKNETKDILDNRFSSKNRTEEYSKNMPSVSNIINDLYPVDLKNPFLLKWLNNQTKEDKIEQDKKNKEAQAKGTEIHLALERYLLDSKRNKLKNIDDYCQDLQYKDLAVSILKPFCKKELENIDMVFSEIFLECRMIQGTIDLISNTKKGLAVQDFKTTSSCDKKTGKPKHKTLSSSDQFQRQVCLYADMLLEKNIITKQEYKNLNFKIHQFQLIGGYYYPIELPRDIVYNWSDSLDRVLDWYWDTKTR